MKKVLKNHRRLATVALALVLAVTTVVGIAITASAEMVNVYSHSGPVLSMANIGNKDSAWIPSGYFTQGGDGSMMDGSKGDNKYEINVNSWAFWEQNDSLDFAYEKVAFNTGRGSIMTIEVTITKWGGMGSGSAGIHVRNSLDAKGTGIYLCVRPGAMYFMYRSAEGVSVNRGLENSSFKDSYPISFKVEINKTKNNATGYYKRAGVDKDWVIMGNIPFVANSQLYAGVAAHNVSQDTYEPCTFENLSIRLDAPEGYVVEEDNGGGGEDAGPAPTEPQIVLPADMPISGDMLLRETFTDGDIFPVGDSITADNAFWTVRTGTPTVEVDEGQTNRYLYLNAADNELMMTAGDFGLTDYSASLDFMYPSDEIAPSETNSFRFLFRHKSVVIGGSSDYAVSLINKFQNNSLVGQYLQLSWRYTDHYFVPKYNGHNSQSAVLKEILLVEGGMLAADVMHNLKVDVLDNTIKVYLDGEEVMTWGDEERAQQNYTDKLYNESNHPLLTGGIGIVAHHTNMRVDNIIIRDLEDPLGGDYDNIIEGAYDQPIPDYLADRYGKG